MISAAPLIDEVIPAEYRQITTDLFRSPGAVAAREHARAFAAALGIADDYQPLVSDDGDARGRADRRILSHFRNNVELIIQKTWVEKGDENHKEKLLSRIPSLVSDLERQDYEHGIKTFISIADELAYLLFGAQGRKGDFIEYAFRIDPCLGLFWWYAGKLSTLMGSADQDRVRTLLLIGVCFLADL